MQKEGSVTFGALRRFNAIMAGLHSSEPGGKVCLGLAGILWNAQTGVKKIESSFRYKELKKFSPSIWG